MSSYIFTDLLNRAPAEIRNNAADARTWLNTNMTQTVSPSKLLERDPDRPRLSPRPQSGRLNMFLYDAKHKQKLPYFDRFPLIFYTGPTSDGFYGMNLHYLPPLLRAKLFDAIQNDEYNQGAVIAAASKLKYYKPCIKRYLNRHVKSRFVTIYPEEWNLAIFLPTVRFNVRKGQVFSDTIGKI